MRTRAALRVAILAGLAATFQVSIFLPGGWTQLAWVALVPLLLAIWTGTARTALAAGWLFGSLAALGLVMGWLQPALADFFGASFVVQAGLLGLAAQLGGGIPLALFALVLARGVRLAPARRVLFAAAAWVGVEYGRGQLPYGMPWAPLGAALAADSLAAQVADLGGVYAVSFVLVTVNAALAEIVLMVMAARVPRPGGEGRGARHTIAALGVAAAVVLLACGYGLARRADVRGRMAAAPTARVALVHAELENARRQSAATAAAALDQYLALSPPPGTVDLVVWPENAVNLLLEDNPELVQRIAARAGATPYLIGAPRTVETRGGHTLRTSALVVAGGRIVESYDKRRLLPFAETMPSLRGGGAALPHGFTAGTTAVMLTAGRLRLGPLICYEAIFPELARAAVHAGAELLVNLSNDSWFAAGAGPLQHARFAELRAVELRRTLLRAANRGITMVVLPDGRVSLATDGATAGVEIATVPLLTVPTVYAQVGDLFAWLCLVAVVLVVAASTRLRC